MMPGENHSKSSGIASDATTGICQNCTVLHQNLKEYVAALLTLERKIFDTDHLLTEYQEKCDELQKSQRETSKLHQQLDELLVKMAPLEKQNEEYEALRSELEEKNSSLKMYQQTSEELDSLKEENSELLAQNKNLEKQLKTFKESNAKDYEIAQLKMEKKKLEKNLHKTQEALEKLELKNQKDLRDMPTQTNFLEKPKINKAKIKLLFEELWMCIEPESQTTNPLHYSGPHGGSSGYQTDSLTPCSVPVWADEVVPEATDTGKPHKRSRKSAERPNHKALVEENKFVEPPGASPRGSHGHYIDKILDLFKPLPPVLSPMRFTPTQETLFGDLSDSGDDVSSEDLEVTDIHQGDMASSRPDSDLQHLECPTDETGDILMMSPPASGDSLDFSAPCTTLMEVGKDSGGREMNIHHSEIQIGEFEEEKFENAEGVTMCVSDESLVDGLAASLTGSCAKESLPSGLPTELFISGNAGSLTNAEAMVVGEAPHEEKKTDAEHVNYENAFPILQQNKHTEDQKTNTPFRDSIKEPQLPPTTVINDNLELHKDIDVHLQTPTGLTNLVKGSLSNCFTQLQESNDTNTENPLRTLNEVTNENMETEQTVSNVTCSQGNEVDTLSGKLTRIEENAADGPEEMMSFSEDNCIVNASLLDLAKSTSKSPHCPNDRHDQEQATDASLSDIPTETDVTLTPPSTLVTVSELQARAVGPKDELEALDFLQRKALSELSKHAGEMVCTTKESRKPNEPEVIAHDAEGSKQMSQVAVVGEATQGGKNTDAEYVNREKALPILQQNKHTEDHQGKCATPNRDSIKEPQLPPTTVINDNLELHKDIDVHLQTPTGLTNLVKGSLSNCFTQLQESNDTNTENPLRTLNEVTNENMETEQTVSNVTCSQGNEVDTLSGKLTRIEENAADGPEEMMSFSEDNCIVNARVLDLSKSTSKSQHCPNDGHDQEQATDASLSDIPTETDVTLTPPSTLVTVSELPARAVGPKDELEALDILQREALSELSKHAGEMVCTTKESRKPNEPEVIAHDAEGSKQMSQVAVVGEATQGGKNTDAEYVNREKALPILQQNKHTEDHQEKCATPNRDSIKEPQLPPTTVINDNLELHKDIDVHLQTPTGLTNLVKGSLSNCFTQLQESNDPKTENPLSTLNYITNENMETEQTVSNVTCSQGNEVDTLSGKLTRIEENAADGPEEMMSFSEDNCIVNARVLDLSKSTSKSPHCPNDGHDQEQATDASLSDFPTETDVTLTPPSTLVTVSELQARAVGPKDESEALDFLQRKALSELSRHAGETLGTTKESRKPSEQEVIMHDVEGSKQTCQVPTGSVLASSSDPTAINIDVDLGRISPPCSDVTPPVVEADSTPAKIPADEDKIEESGPDDPAKCKESSDEQESFGLQRKVKTVYQRAGNQASSESVNIMIKAETGSTRPHEGSGNSQGTSCERPEAHSLNTGSCYLTSHDSSHAKLALLTNGIKSEVTEDGLLIQEKLAGMLQCEYKMSNDHEEPLKREIKECKTNVIQPEMTKDHGCCLPPKLSSELKERPCSLQVDERTEENTAGEITQEVALDKAQVDKSSTNNGKDFLTESTAHALTFKNLAIPSCNRQHSSKGQESASMDVKSTNPPTLASVDASTPAKSPEAIRKARFEIGPPLPPLLNPLTVTPPRFARHRSRTVPSKLSFPSLMSEEIPMQEDSISPLQVPLSNGSSGKPPCLSLPSSCETKHKRVLSSPLQFCATTPKHAVPVPGRLPPSASGSASSSPSAPQENSVRILDTMYPDLSARARTLNILRRSVDLNTCTSANGMTPPDPVHRISRFKAVNSSTVFAKSPQTNKCEFRRTIVESTSPSNGRSSALGDQFGKRTGVNMLLPRSAKKFKRDGDSPVSALLDGCLKSPEGVSHGVSAGIMEGGQVGNSAISAPNPITDALKRIEASCFDLLPVIKSHVHIGRISKVPVLRDEEVEVISEFSAVKKLLADDLLSAILMKMKAERSNLCGPYIQALCRVYTGICRQREDWERAHLFAYSILKEDFPDSAKLILFMVTTWYNILSNTGVLCQAMHAVVRLRAHGEVLHCLTAYLHWETNPPCDAQKLISNALTALKTGENMQFLHHDRHGDDLNPAAWAHVFTLDLLCTQQRWKWTQDNVIRKELWPAMNSWVEKPRLQQTPISDVSVASVLRLIGRLGQLGIKEKAVGPVKTLATAINMFGRHGKKEGVPWPVQLAAVYAIYDLSPSNPKEALEALAAWRGETSESVPPAVTSCITQIASVCRYVKS